MVSDEHRFKGQCQMAPFSHNLRSSCFTQACFLPESLGRHYNARSLVAKVLTSLVELAGTTPAARHAASQILLRTKYLIFDNSEVVRSRRTVADFCFDKELVALAKRVVIVDGKIHTGAQPRMDIFNRVIYRGSGFAAGDSFPSALHAVQELSFGSIRVRHVNPIDDVLIANNIASSADGGTSESYGYVWSWEDDRSAEEELTKQDELVNDGRCRSMSMMALAMVVPNLCGCDTT